jgi:transcriptional regulator with XRE-family HTH domain
MGIDGDEYVLYGLRMTKLERIRKRLNWHQHQMGAYLGLTQATISRIERGENEERGPVRRLLDDLEARLEAGEIIEAPAPSSPVSPAEDSGDAS